MWVPWRVPLVQVREVDYFTQRNIGVNLNISIFRRSLKRKPLVILEPQTGDASTILHVAPFEVLEVMQHARQLFPQVGDGWVGKEQKTTFLDLANFFPWEKTGERFHLGCVASIKQKTNVRGFYHFGMFPSKKKTNDIFLFILVGEETCNLSDSFCFLSILDDPGRMPPKHWQNHDYDNRTLLYIWDLPPPSRIPTANKGLYLLYTQLKM